MFSIGQLTHDWKYYLIDKVFSIKAYTNKKNKESVYENIFVFDQHA